ncbi:MAG: RNA 2',3'-cyclic phosphodiesterase [Candidatus Magnetoovum sp. WYHC-5]|nr:RNA 2',3'-cyclic phosphodiesterase [Candidatus Magnetoovum sp. WYHC-5]
MEIRSFISINLPIALKTTIDNTITELKAFGRDVKWIKGEALHITMKFLGNINVERLALFEEVLTETSTMHSPFDLKFSGLGFFPNQRYPKIVWIAVNTSPALNKLQAEIDDKFEKLGFSKEKRKFSPHLTIGRIKDDANTRTLTEKVLSMGNTYFGTFTVNSFFLMKSDLQKDGAKYTVIKEFPL